jgi:16S rRNA processing protein RimM
MSHQAIIIAKLAKPYGLKGWMHLYSFTEPSEQLFLYSPIFIERTHHDIEQLTIEQFTPKSDHWLVKLQYCDNRTLASQYTNKLIKIHTHQLTLLPLGEYYWHQLKGLTVINSTGDSIGTVIDVMETGSNDVLIVKGDKIRYIAYHHKYILQVDLTNRTITVDWDKDF